jgi:Ca-activated chloride channel family protein
VSALLAAPQLLRPEWLWALLALSVIVAAWGWQRRRASVWHRHVDAHLLPHLVESGATSRGIGGLLARLLAWTLAVLALAGPSWREGEAPLLEQGGALVIALDLSDAVLAPDLPPSRLLQARAKLATLLREREGGEVALLAFADDAYTVAPLTDDAANVALFLDALAPEVMPVDGHRPDRAILAAMRLLTQAGRSGGDILLISHEADGAAIAAAARAAAQGFRVSALGLGSDSGAAFRARDGSLRTIPLDPAALQRLADAGGGRYASLSVGDEDLKALQLLAADAAADTTSPGRGRVRIARDEGWWLLPPLMLLGLLAFRRGAAVAVLAACLLLPLQLRAAEPPAGTPWRRADQVQHDRLREALDAYRAGRFDEAAKAWQALPGADAAYNRGNALARAGRLEEAIDAYDQALARQPGMADALANRALVEAALRRDPPPGGGQQRQQPQGNEQRAGKGEQGGEDAPATGAADPADSGAEAGQDPPAAPPEEAPQTPESSRSEPPQPGAADAQQEADAAQQQRMQRALENARPADDGEPQPGDPERPETEAERERRQAGEAWLRRVPDDPGGLLRARFRLEHERRHGGGSRP